MDKKWHFSTIYSILAHFGPLRLLWRDILSKMLQLQNPSWGPVCGSLFMLLIVDCVHFEQVHWWQQTGYFIVCCNSIQKYTARFSLHQVHGSQCTKEYYVKYSWRTLGVVCMVSEVLRVVPHCRVLLYLSVALDVPSMQTVTRYLWLSLTLVYSVALGCRVLTVGCHSTMVAHYGTTPQPTCSY